uniref:Uncharacterized protein n=1 Tax=Homalodisca liturata TaxID=320908 RepID=A0A1B6IWD7_9HEMI
MADQGNELFSSKLVNKVIKSQTREIVSNVAKFMKAEADAGRFLIDVKKVNARVSAATGVSERTVTRIKSKRKKVEESDTSFETPNKNRILPKRVTELDDFNLGVVRRIVDNFYLIEKQLPTLKGIQEKMRSDISFTGSKDLAV